MCVSQNETRLEGQSGVFLPSGPRMYLRQRRKMDSTRSQIHATNVRPIRRLHLSTLYNTSPTSTRRIRSLNPV
jgi:hypothetical protein